MGKRVLGVLEMRIAKEIDDLLVVDLDEGGSDLHCALLPARLRLSEDVADSAGDDADGGEVAEVGGSGAHGESFATWLAESVLPVCP